MTCRAWFGLLSLSVFPASAFSGVIWDGGGIDDLWGTGANWSPDGSPSPGATVDLTFTGSTRLAPSNNYTAFDDFRNITFDAAAGSFAVSGNAIDLFGKIENYSANAQTVSLAELAINAGQPGTGEFNPVNGDLNINSANVFTNGNTLHVYGTSGKTVTFGASTVISGAGHFNVEQASNAVFLGNNTYSGTTNVLAGSLTVGNGGTTGALGTGTVTVASGATLTVNRSDAVTLGQALNIGGSLVKNGAGTLTISAAQAGLTGSVAINAGRISLGANNSLGAAAVTLNGGSIERNAAGVTVSNNVAIGASGGTILGRQVVDDYTTFSGVISGSGALTVQGLVVFNNTGNTHSGNITVSNASATYFRLSASEVIGNASAVTLGGANARLRLDGGVTETIGSLAGSGDVFVSKTGAVLPGTLKFGGDNSSTSYTGSLSNNDGQLFLVKQGAGTFTLTPSGASFQALTVSTGAVIAGNGTFGSATITLGDTDTGAGNVAFLTTTAGSSRNITVSASGTGTATLGSTTGAGTGNVPFSGTITLNRATTLTAASTDRTTWSGKITGNVGTLTIAGGQRTVFESASGLNDFTGDVAISGAGTVLQIGAGSGTGENIPNTSSVTVASGAFLKLASNAGSTETINALNGSGVVRRHEGVSGLQTLVLGASNASGSFSGTLENGGGSLALVKNGTGTQTVTSVSGNTASGGVTVNAGTLKFTGAAGFDAGSLSNAQTYTVNTGGTLEFQGDWLTKSTSTYNITGGTLAFTKTGVNTDLSYVNNLNLTNGTVSGPGFYRVGNNTTATHTFSGDSGNVISSGFGMVKNGAAQTVNLTVNDGAADADLLVSGVISDVSGFTGATLNKQGLGKMVLTSANTYTGPTTITAGTFQVGNGGTSGSPGSGAITNNAALVFNRGDALTVNNVITGTGTLLQTGGGATTLGGASSYTGATTISSGSLLAASNTAFGTSAITLGDASTGSSPVSLILSNRSDITNAVTVSALGTGTATIGADNTGSGLNAATFTGTVTLNRPTTFSGQIAADRLAFEGRITGNVGTLTVAGGARTTFSATTNDFVGDIVVTGAGTILQASVATAAEVIPDTSSVTVQSGAVFQLSYLSGTETIAGLNGSGTVRTHVGGFTAYGSSLTVGFGGVGGSFSGTLSDGVGPLALVKIGSGTQVLSGANTYTGGTTLSAGVLSFAGGSLGSSGPIAFSGSSTLRWEAGNTQDVSARLAAIGTGITATLDTNGNNVELASALSGAGSLLKSGSGTLTLSGDSSYSGGTTVGAGTAKAGHVNGFGTGTITLLSGATLNLNSLNLPNAIDNSAGGTITGGSVSGSVTQSGGGIGGSFGGILTASGSVTTTSPVTASGTLKGTATFTGALVTVDGIHAPGNSPGIQTFASGLSYGASSTLEWEFVGDTLAIRGTDYDGVNVTGGNLTIASGATLKLLATGVDYTATDWDSIRSFTVVAFSGGGSSSDNFTTLDTSAAGSFAGQGIWSSANLAGEIILTWTPVPEPSTYATLAGLAALGLAWKRRRRSQGARSSLI